MRKIFLKKTQGNQSFTIFQCIFIGQYSISSAELLIDYCPINIHSKIAASYYKHQREASETSFLILAEISLFQKKKTMNCRCCCCRNVFFFRSLHKNYKRQTLENLIGDSERLGKQDYLLYFQSVLQFELFYVKFRVREEKFSHAKTRNELVFCLFSLI